MPNFNNAKFISLASPKGGVGKSTAGLSLAGALLARGEQVRIVDFDQTETIWRWYTTSPSADAIPGLTVEKGPTDNLDAYVSNLWETATGYVIIDLAGSLSDLTIAIASFADLIITPAKVSEPDIIEANKMMVKMHALSLRMKKPLNHFILLNEVPSSISKDEVALIAQVDDSNLNRFRATIRRRSAYSKSFSRGTLPHFTDQPDPKALVEIEALLAEIDALFAGNQQKAAA